MKKLNYSQILWPAIAFFAFYFVAHLLFDGASFEPMVSVVAGLIGEVAAFLTWGVFVGRKGKSVGHAWLNYALWALVLTGSTIARALGR